MAVLIASSGASPFASPAAIAELANQNYSTVERIKKRVEEAEAEIAKAVYKTTRELGGEEGAA